MTVSNITEFSRRNSQDNTKLGSQLGVPTDVAMRVMNRTRAELDALAALDPAGDARPIIQRAVDELDAACPHKPMREAILEQRVRQLPDRSYKILQLHTQGKNTREIAEIMGMKRWRVRLSLAWTYTKLMREGDGHDDGEPQPIEPHETDQRAA